MTAEGGRAVSYIRASLIAALAIILTAGCVTLTPEQQHYLSGIARESLTFRIPRTQEGDAWGRAQSFLGKYSSMKLQTATDYVLQTYNPAQNQVDYGYNVTKTPVDTKTVEIDVQCASGNMYAGAEADRNARILASYIRTGQLPHPELIAK